MKFQLLKPGDRFIYEDEIYTKSTPLVAINQTTGESRLIPRSALLKPMADTVASASDETNPDKDLQASLQNSCDNFIRNAQKILQLTDSEQQSVSKLYMEVTARLIKKFIN